jgi:hypothetical protein
MKTSTKTTIVLKALDLELKAILKKDIEKFRQQQLKNNEAAFRQLLAA